ncbi:MAG: hypothetical protein JO133_10120 [Burkholderiaceae bacterium]|nr:hypothetical protein [Burkholderiaceae bacterium]
MIAAHTLAERWTLARCLLAATVMLAGCGGGGGGGGQSPTGAQSCTPSVISSYAPIVTSGYVDGSGDGTGGVGGRGGSSSGVGAGGGLGVYSNALVSVQRADGTQLGSALTDSYGMVTVSNCGNTQALLFTVQGTATGTYWDESLRTPVAFGPTQVLHAVVVPDAPNQQTLYRNVGVTPLTEAVYQYLLNGSAGARSWTVAANVTAANDAIASQINQVLPPNLQLQGTDITRLAAVTRDSTSQVFSASTPNSIYGLVIGGMAQAAGLHNAQSKNPGLDLLNQLAADLSDGDLDGAKNGTAVAPSTTQAAYNLPTMTADTLGGIAALAATNGQALPPVTYTSYTLSGTISGLSASGLVLADDTSTVAVPSGATSFTFNGVLTSGAPYSVSIQQRPSSLPCSVANGSGTAGAANVTNVVVTCSSTSYMIGGTITGLTASGLVLANGSDTLNVAAGTSNFTMPQNVAAGGAYAVTVQTQPTGESCTVTNGTGTATATVNNIAVSCSATGYLLSGKINGLTVGGLVLANNNSATIGPFSANTPSFSFGPVLTAGSNYSVTVQTTPTGLTCNVAYGSGTAGAADVTNVVVTCSSEAYKLGGSITGLTASGLVLENNSADPISVLVNATNFQFDQLVAYSSQYSVSVATQPTGLSCGVSNGTGSMPANNVSSVTVTCSPQTSAYMVTGQINGLTQPGLQLKNQDNGDHVTVLAGANSFQLPTAVDSGTAYSVIVAANPIGETCNVANGDGTMGTTGVTNNIVVSCSLNTHKLGGNVSGLNLGGLLGLVTPLVLASNDVNNDTVTVPFNTSGFTFPNLIPYGTSYNVTVQQQPSIGVVSLTCTVQGNGMGTMPDKDVANVVVQCL